MLHNSLLLISSHVPYSKPMPLQILLIRYTGYNYVEFGVEMILHYITDLCDIRGLYVQCCVDHMSIALLEAYIRFSLFDHKLQLGRA